MSLMCPISMSRYRGQPDARAQVTVSLRFVQSGHGRHNTVQYVLMLYQDEAGFWLKLTQSGQQRAIDAYEAFTSAMEQAGVLRDASRFQPYYTATTVCISNGKLQVAKQPYADSKEQLGGYFLIEVPDRDAAISWAISCPAASHGVVEVRPLEIAR